MWGWWEVPCPVETMICLSLINPPCQCSFKNFWRAALLKNAPPQSTVKRKRGETRVSDCLIQTLVEQFLWRVNYRFHLSGTSILLASPDGDVKLVKICLLVSISFYFENHPAVKKKHTSLKLTIRKWKECDNIILEI